MCSAVLRGFWNGGTVYLCCVGAAVCQFSTSGDDYGDFAFVSGWAAAGTFGGTKVSRAVRFDWRGFADGNCDEKFDFAVDYAIMNQRFGKPMYEATLEEGVARLRPI
jgi:hypothetical protein